MFLKIKVSLLFWGKAVNPLASSYPLTQWTGSEESAYQYDRGFAVWTFYKLHCLTFSLGGLTNLPDSCLVCGSRAVQDYAYVYPWNQGSTLVKLHAQHWLIMPLLLVMESVTQKGLCLLTESTSGCHTAVHSSGLILSWFTPHPVHGCNSSRCATCW